MIKFFFGILVGICLLILGAYFFVTRGGMPVAVKSQELPFEHKIARTAIALAVIKDRKIPSPVPADEPNLLSGAKIYASQCSMCHGKLQQKAPYMATAMFPKAPQLLTPEDYVTTDDDDPVGKIHWKVKYGIRLTGMPGFEDALTDTEMWQVSQMLHHADHLSGPVQEVLK